MQTSYEPSRLDAWAPYARLRLLPWDRARVVHLHRRAGFAATWAEIERDLRDGPEASVTRVAERKSAARRQRRKISRASRGAGRVGRLDVDRPTGSRRGGSSACCFRPIRWASGSTFMWHNHFATSNLKVNDLVAMRRQNEIFREYARAPFGELLRHAIKDPALLDWLDAPANRKEHPNENLARESMELFTIGVGNFSENDVKEAARALTGWSYKAGRLPRISAVPRRRREKDPRPPRPLSRRRFRRAPARAAGHFGASGPAAVRTLHGRGPGDADAAEAPCNSGPWPTGGRSARAPTRYRLGRRADPAVAGFFRCDQSESSRVVVRPNSRSARCRRCELRSAAQHAAVWPSGSAGWGRTCSIRRTSSAGRAGGAG